MLTPHPPARPDMPAMLKRQPSTERILELNRLADRIASRLANKAMNESLWRIYWNNVFDALVEHETEVLNAHRG